jgi:hypothetical protein
MTRHVHKARRRIVTRARDWQHKGDIIRTIADEQRPKIKRALLNAIRTFRQSIDFAEFKRTGVRSTLAARNAFPRKRFEDALRKAFEAIATCYEDAGKAAALQVHNLTLHAHRTRYLRKDDAPGFGGSYAFDRFTPEVQDALRTMQDEFIQNLSQEAADAVEAAIYDGMVEGWSVDEIAAAIRDVIGLNDRQVRAVDTYRGGLEARGDMAASEIDDLVEAYVEASLDYRAGMIAQTESIRAANLGLHDGYAQAIDRGLFPQEAVKRYWQIALDEGTCPICEAIPDDNDEGVEVGEPFETDDGPIMDPPVHPNCLAGNSLVTSRSRIAAVSKRWFDGDIVVVRTAAGKELACTPNHPILTDRGWVPAGRLDIGSNVIRSLRREWEAPCDLYGENVPAPIHEVAEAFRRSSKVAAVEVPMTAEDFHGDGEGSKVAIIWTDRLLRGSQNGPFLKKLAGDYFINRLLRLKHLAARAGRKVLNGTLAASYRVMSGAHLRFAPVGWHERPFYSFSFSVAPQRDTAFEKRSADNLSSDAKLARDLINGSAGPVALDKVLSVRQENFSGHVYNLETAGGYYTAEGIIVHNCRCSVTYVTDLDKVETDDEEAA